MVAFYASYVTGHRHWCFLKIQSYPKELWSECSNIKILVPVEISGKRKSQVVLPFKLWIIIYKSFSDKKNREKRETIYTPPMQGVLILNHESRKSPSNCINLMPPR